MSELPRAQRYRDEATRLREKAAQASAPDIGRDLQKIARQYELLAERIEERAKQPGGVGQVSHDTIKFR